MSRCESECPKKWKQQLYGDIPAGLHGCDVQGRHISHHCAGCGATWDENMRAVRALIEKSPEAEQLIEAIRKSKREVPAVE